MASFFRKHWCDIGLVVAIVVVVCLVANLGEMSEMKGTVMVKFCSHFSASI